MKWSSNNQGILYILFFLRETLPKSLFFLHMLKVDL